MPTKTQLQRKTKAELIDLILGENPQDEVRGQPEVEAKAIEQAEEAIKFFVQRGGEASVRAQEMKAMAEKLAADADAMLKHYRRATTTTELHYFLHVFEEMKRERDAHQEVVRRLKERLKVQQTQILDQQQMQERISGAVDTVMSRAVRRVADAVAKRRDTQADAERTETAIRAALDGVDWTQAIKDEDDEGWE